MKIFKPTKKQILYLFLGIILLGIFCIFLFRNTLLQKTIAKAQSKFKTEYNCNLEIQSATFEGLSSLRFNEITLVPHKADTLIYIQQLQTSVSLWHLFFGDVQLGKLYVDKGYLQLVKNENGKNFDAFFKNDTPKDTNARVNYAYLVNKLLTKSLNLVPTDMSVKGFSVRVSDMDKKATMAFNDLHLSNKNLKAIIHVSYNNFSQYWNISGFADPRNNKANIKFYNNQKGKVQIPYLDERYQLITSFDTVTFTLDNLEMHHGELHVAGKSKVKNFLVHHPKIANENVLIANAGFDYRFVFGERFVAVDSSSTMQINHIKCHPYLSFTNDKEKIYRAVIKVPKIQVQTFIESLPDGLFSQIKDMEAQGAFSYRLDFEYNKNHLNDLIFKSSVTPEDLKVIKFGKVDLDKINHEFVYRAVENGVVQRPVVVGMSNPNFTPLPSVSQYVINGVLTNEDPSFYNHKGFVDEAFRMSIIKNIKTKKFSRGASTISMQLVKNVFLNREKTLSRKLEEILLVYALENQRVVSKQRMLEVYFNVIEWGPNVYGIGEAARFYFQKAPSELTLNESLFLASIVPSPKKFMYRFDTTGALRDYAKKQIDFTKNLMLRRNLLQEADTIGSGLPLKIEGNARSYLRVIEKDSLLIDTLSTPEEFDF